MPSSNLVGWQAQAPYAPYYRLWSRIEGFTGGELSDLLTERKAVRIVVMRGTIHLDTAADSHRLRSLVQPMLDRMLRAVHGKALADVDLKAVVSAAKALLDTDALSPGEVGALLAERFPSCPTGALAEAVRSLLPLVQVPPRALWQRSGQVRLTTATGWLGPPADTLTVDDLVLRHLGAFGPASAADMQTWSGLSRLGEVFDRLAPQLMRSKANGDKHFTICPTRRAPAPTHPHPCASLRRSTTFCSLMSSAPASSATSTARGCSPPATVSSPAQFWLTDS